MIGTRSERFLQDVQNGIDALEARFACVVSSMDSADGDAFLHGPDFRLGRNPLHLFAGPKNEEGRLLGPACALVRTLDPDGESGERDAFCLPCGGRLAAFFERNQNRHFDSGAVRRISPPGGRGHFLADGAPSFAAWSIPMEWTPKLFGWMLRACEASAPQPGNPFFGPTPIFESQALRKGAEAWIRALRAHRR